VAIDAVTGGQVEVTAVTRGRNRLRMLVDLAAIPAQPAARLGVLA
jgi:hypothetical protein